MKHIKLFEEFVYADESTDEEVADELRKLFKDTKYEEDVVEQKINQLIHLFHKWIKEGKRLYDKSDIARRLFQYQK